MEDPGKEKKVEAAEPYQQMTALVGQSLKMPGKYEGYFKGVLDQVVPDTNTLIVIGLVVIVIYAQFTKAPDAGTLANSVVSGLLGYLGKSMSDAQPKTPLPSNVITGVK